MKRPRDHPTNEWPMLESKLLRRRRNLRQTIWTARDKCLHDPLQARSEIWWHYAGAVTKGSGNSNDFFINLPKQDLDLLESQAVRTVVDIQSVEIRLEANPPRGPSIGTKTLSPVRADTNVSNDLLTVRRPSAKVCTRNIVMIHRLSEAHYSAGDRVRSPENRVPSRAPPKSSV